MKQISAACFALLLLASTALQTEAFFLFRNHPNTDRHHQGRLLSSQQLSEITGSKSHRHLKFKNFEGMLDAFRDELVVVYFTKDTCGPCLLQRRELVALRQQRLPVLTIDTVKWPEIGSRYQVGKLPCLLVVKNQAIVSRLEGLTTAADLLRHITRYVDTTRSIP